jgi:hypothetical protein
MKSGGSNNGPGRKTLKAENKRPKWARDLSNISKSSLIRSVADVDRSVRVKPYTRSEESDRTEERTNISESMCVGSGDSRRESKQVRPYAGSGNPMHTRPCRDIEETMLMESRSDEEDPGHVTP